MELDVVVGILPKAPMSEDLTKSADWLSHEDSVCREDRIARLEWLASVLPPAEQLQFPGGLMSMFLFDEMRYCFVYGQYLGTVVLGLAYIERTLAAKFYAAGRVELEGAGIAALLREARAVGLLAAAEADEIDRIRRTRNPVTHFRRPLHRESVEFRSLTEDDHPYELLERDARTVVQTAVLALARDAV